ncbi:MAG: type II toxin-antitoxin system RelE/ParE family toxin [Magnetococcales bacterium]|nr:type II toxin-antitoxin system RelE/ParE family toxin [Magnetococcales bacterium]
MKIYFYKDEKGNRPVSDFLDKVSDKAKSRLLLYLRHLADNEGKMEGLAFRKLHGYPLEEVRVKESRNLHRVIIKVRFRDSVIILHGFTKKEGQETAKKELEIAYKRYLKFIENN